LHAGLITPDVYNATLAASLVTILANATLWKLMKPASAGSPRDEAAPVTQPLTAGDLSSAVQQPNN
jgi:hypothetical protein